MQDIKLITNENIPCWYELSWLKEKVGILLRVHKDFAESAPVLTAGDHIPRYFIEEFKFSKFSGDLKSDFGFDGTFIFNGEHEDFCEFLVPFPKIFKWAEEKCRWCKGAKTDPITGDKCGSCNGSGKEHFLDWRPARAISASFNVFFSLAYSPETETSAKLPQLMTVNVVTARDLNGGSLGGYFGIDLYNWLKSLEDGTPFPAITQAMTDAEEKMFRKLGRFDRREFQAFISSQGCIALQVQGNACDISNEADWHFGKGKLGCRFGCHNVDSPMQQLELLAGLSALHDLARKEIKQN